MMKSKFEIEIEGDYDDGYDLLIDGKKIDHFDGHVSDDELVEAIYAEFQDGLQNHLAMQRKSVDTITVPFMTIKDIYDLCDTLGIESRDKIYEPLHTLADEDSKLEISLRLDRVKGKIYATMINGVMLEREAEII